MTSVTSMTVAVPLTIRRRGGRKQIIGPDGASVQAGADGTGVATTRGDPALVKALARAFRWRRMLEDGRYASVRELARAENLNRTYIARLLNLALLAPDIVEAVLDGRDAQEFALPLLLQPLPEGWTEQRRALGWSGAPR